MPKHRVPNLPGKTNWVEQAGGLPPAIENVAGAILDDPTSGIKDVSRAVSTAVSRAKVWAAKGNAKYIKAVAQWEKLRAKAHVKKSELPDLVERMSPVTVDDVLAIPVEERRDLIKSLEAEEALEAGPPPATAPRTSLFKALGGGEKFDEKEHPRWPKGTPGIGGKFCPKGMPGPSIRLASQVLAKLNHDNKQHAELAKRFHAEAKATEWSKESNADAKTRELLQKNIVEPLAGAAPEAKGGKDTKAFVASMTDDELAAGYRRAVGVDYDASTAADEVKGLKDNDDPGFEMADAIWGEIERREESGGTAGPSGGRGGYKFDITLPTAEVKRIAGDESSPDKDAARAELRRRGESREGKPGKANADGKDPWLGGEDGPSPGLSDEAKRKRLEGAANATDEDTDHADGVASKLKREEEGKLNGGYTLEHGAEGGWILHNPDGSSDQGSKRDVLDIYAQHRRRDNTPPEAKREKKGTTKDGLADELEARDNGPNRIQRQIESGVGFSDEDLQTELGDPNNSDEDRDFIRDYLDRTSGADASELDRLRAVGSKPSGDRAADMKRRQAEADAGAQADQSTRENIQEFADPATSPDRRADLMDQWIEAGDDDILAEAEQLLSENTGGDFKPSSTPSAPEQPLLAPGADVPEQWRAMLTDPKLGGWDDADVDDATAGEAFESLQTLDIFPDSMELKDVTQDVLDAAPPKGGSKKLDLRDVNARLTSTPIGGTADLGFGMRAERTGEDEYTQHFPDGESVEGLTGRDVRENAEDEATFNDGATVVGGINGPVAEMNDDTLETKIDLLRRARREARFNGDDKAGKKAQKELNEALKERRARKSPEAELPNPGGPHRGAFISGRNKLKAGNSPNDLSPDEKVALLASIDEAERTGAVGALKDATDLLRETLAPPAPSAETLSSMSTEDLQAMLSRGGAAAAAARRELNLRRRTKPGGTMDIPGID